MFLIFLETVLVNPWIGLTINLFGTLRLLWYEGISKTCCAF